MKKAVTSILLFGLIALVPVASADAKTSPVVATSSAAAGSAAIKPCPRGTFRVRKNTKTKTKLVNTLLAGGVGTAIGGGLGGGRGALLGAGVGSGGYLTYRYIKDRRGRCVPRRIR